MDHIESEQKNAEELAKHAQFEDSGPQTKVVSHVVPGVRWDNVHFADLSEAERNTMRMLKIEQEENNRRRLHRRAIFRRIRACLIAVIMLGGSGAVAADYFGYVHLGIFDHRTNPSQQNFIERIVYRTVPIREVERVTVREPAIEQGSASAPAPTKPEMPNSVRDHVKHLTDGIGIMDREFNETEDIAVRCRWELTIRPPPQQQYPFTAAERIARLNQWFATHRMNLAESRELGNQMRDAQADYSNAQTRLGECTDKEDSLDERTEKAKDELKRIHQQYLP